MKKNTASQKLYVRAITAATQVPTTGDAANLTAYVAKDFGSLTVLTDTSATEVDSTNAKGYYVFDLAQAETNADTLLFSCKSATVGVVVTCCPDVCYTRDDATTATALLDLTDGVESGKTLRQAMRALGSFAGGNITSDGEAYAALGNSGTNRLTITNPTSTTRSVTTSL